MSAPEKTAARENVKGPAPRAGGARIAAAFAAGRREARPLIVPFITAGFPTAGATLPIVRELAAAGADMIEIGMPFSDPLADGPTIQRASEVALRNGTTVANTLERVAALRAEGLALPLVLMGYCNPLYAHGLERFVNDAAAAGVDGMIVADLPPEEADDYLAACGEAGMSATFLVAPNAPDERIRRVDGASTHFSYCVTVTGVTGARHDVQRRSIDFLARMRRLASKPFVVGFGVKEPAHVTALGPHADGVVIGSALIDAIEAASGASTLAKGGARSSPMRHARRDAAGGAAAEAGHGELEQRAAAAAAAVIRPLREAADLLANDDATVASEEATDGGGAE
jgi:tryptophan synthase alpha chain